MPTARRLTAVLTASSLGWVLLALGVAAPAAHADVQPPHDPATYYAGTEGLTGTALATTLNGIIDGHTRLSYTPGVWDALMELDRDPNDPDRIIDVYSGDSLLATNRCGSTCPNADSWNREHVWSQSRGSFDTAPGPGTDLFHMRPSRATTNSSRGNLDFDETVNSGGSVPGCPVVCQRDGNSFEPREAIKGDIARGLFYMDVRYNGDADDEFGVDLRMWDQTGSSNSQLGVLSTLVAWSLADPPDAAERARNDLIDSNYQHNRNPFIDHPEWVCSIWSVPACATGENHAPTAQTVSVATPRNVAKEITLLGSDVDGDLLSYAIVGQPAHGSVSVSGATATYTPATDFSGEDSFTYTANDPSGATSAPATVSITVTATQEPPVATAVSTTTEEDEPSTFTLTASDPNGDPLSFAVGTQPAHGSVSITGDQATYTPAANHHGPDSFTWTVSDGTATDSASASITVTPVNDAPVASPRAVQTPEDTARSIGLPSSDVEGDPRTHAIATGPQHGTVILDGSLATYTPDANYHGPDSFTFTASDASSTSAPATVTVTVTSVEDAPVAAPVTATAVEDGVSTFDLTGIDGDDDPLQLAIATQPAHGSVSLAGEQVTYTPVPDFHGADSFTWTVSDGKATTTGTATVTVTGVNDAPSVTGGALSTTVGRPVSTTLSTADVDGDVVSVSAVSGAAPGTVSHAGATLTYTPTTAGSDALVVTVSDGHGGTATTQVLVEVAKAAPRLRIVARALQPGEPGVVKVKVRGVAGLSATGKVTLTVGSQKLTAKVVKGVATFRVARLPDVTKLKVKARYSGDSRYAAGSVKRTYLL